MENIYKDIRLLTDKLYFNLPFWKRWNIFRWYKKNNWDVSGEYQKCFKVADKMCRDKNYWLGEPLIDKKDE